MIRPPSTRRFRRERARFTTVCALGVLSALLLAHGVATAFGVIEVTGLLALLSLGAVAVADRDFHRTPQLLLLTAVSIVMIFVVDLALLFVSSDKGRAVRVRGLYTEDEEIGFRLTPGWSQVYSDRVVESARYTVNALGHRDAMPHDDGSKRVLLLGDSMTFGELLDDRETIDRQVESLSDTAFDAYNLGVPGYGAPACEAMFARTNLTASHVVYLFYENDLRNDGFSMKRNRVWKGLLTAGENGDGVPYTDGQLDKRVARSLAPSRSLLDTLRLRHLFRAGERAFDTVRLRSLEDLSVRREGPLGYRRENVGRVLEHSLAMQKQAQSRGMDFALVILPSMREAAVGERYSLVREYADSARASGISVVDPFETFDETDFFPHDGHFNSQGARKTAEVIVSWLRETSRS